MLDKTVANTTKGTIVRDMQACETAASLHGTLRKRQRKKASDIHSSLSGKPHTTVVQTRRHKKVCGEAADGSELQPQEVLLNIFRLLSGGSQPRLRGQ